MSNRVRAGRASAGTYGNDRQPHIIRVAGAPQIAFSWPGMQMAWVSRISLQARKLGVLDRLMGGSPVVGAKLAPTALLDRLPASANIPSSDFLDLRPMTQTLFPAAR
jgi:hypothetical protein